MNLLPAARLVEPPPGRLLPSPQYGGEAYRDAGIVYVCYGRDEFYAEVRASIRSVRQHMPDVRITVFAERPEALEDEAVERLPLERGPDPELNGAPFYLKPWNLRRAPYRRTLYLDGDTLAVLPFWELFDVLARFDVAGCVEGSLESQPAPADDSGRALGLSFPEWNLGVLGLRCGEVVTQLLDRWLQEYERLYAARAPGGILSWNDQIPFRIAAWNSEARLLTLPNNYNAKVHPFDVSTVQREVKILHGRHADLSRVGAHVNRRLFRRVLCGGRCVPVLSLRNGQVSHQTYFTLDAAPAPHEDPANSHETDRQDT